MAKLAEEVAAGGTTEIAQPLAEAACFAATAPADRAVSSPEVSDAGAA
jgi:hypothetical protein